MSLSEGIAAKLSPADSDPSPPTSPRLAKTVDEPPSPSPSGLSATKAKTSSTAIGSVVSTEAHVAHFEASDEASKLKTWKAALSLSEMTCGSTTKQQEPCNKRISIKKMERMDQVVKLLWVSSNSSLEVERHFDDLAKLLHCRLHDAPPMREVGVSLWMNVLPGGPRVPSPQKQMRDSQGSAPTNCTSVTLKGKPCGNKIIKFFSEKTVKKMVQLALEPTEEDETISFLAQVLQYHTLCHLHRAWPDRQQDDWKSRIQRLGEACEDELNVSNNEKSVSQATTEDLIDQGKLASPPPKPKTAKGPGAYWDSGFETSGFAILGRGDMTDEDKLVADEIRDGFIYLYKVPGNDNLVKIGFNTDSVDVRVKTWQEKCHREAQVLHATDSRERVPHAQRVEMLVHAELMERRVRHYCERCTAQHVEWFEAEVEEAAAVTDKWSRWMRTRPYQRRMTRQNVAWYLKEAEKKRLADVSLFLKHLEGTS
ncbi:hypothetical protein MY4824_001997 [Beauveria thailandica]